MHLIAQELLKAGHSVILDATYGRDVHRQALRDLAEECHVPLRIIQCRVPPKLAVERFKARAPGHFAVDLTEALVWKLAEEYVYSPDALVVETESSVADLLDRADLTR